MSLLSTPGFLLRSTRSHDTIERGQQSNSQPLRSRTSIANLVQFARHPLENVGETFEDWYDGSTKDQRVQRQTLEDRKQLLTIKLRNVGFSNPPRHSALSLTLCRQPAGQTGKRLLSSLMNWKATTNGKLFSTPQNMTPLCFRHD